MSKERVEWLDSVGNLNPDLFVEGPDVDWSEVEVYATPDWVRHPERYPELMKRLQELGDKWSEGLRKNRD